jgi:hypothetical protein
MSKYCYIACIAIIALALLPPVALALELGLGQLVSVTPVDGGCVLGPTGPTVQAWDVERGKTYTLTITNVTDCANGGTDPTLNVRVNSSTPGYEYTDLVAYYVSPGVYQFDYTVPPNGVCTLPILYCTVPGEWLTTGMFVRRSDGGNRQGHLRVSEFLGPGCTYPQMWLGEECGAVPTEASSWGVIKALYD